MTEAERIQVEAHPILLYDGVCALCNHLVRFLIRRDKRASLRFTPLESPLGKELLASQSPSSVNLHIIPDGVVLVTSTLSPGEHIYHRSDAVAQALQLLDNPWKSTGKALARTPRSLREPTYSLIACLRYRIFGRYSTCPIPTSTQRDRILGVYE